MDVDGGLSKIGCIILSGGLSRRMNAHKALLNFDVHESFIQHIIEVYLGAGLGKVVVVKNFSIKIEDQQRPSVIVADNHVPEKGRIYSIQLGLAHMSDIEYCFIQNVDNPFVSIPLLKDLLSVRRNGDYISPSYNGHGGHPVLISRRAMDDIANTTDYNRTLHEVLSASQRIRVNTEDERCLININTPSDYAKNISGVKI